MDQYQCRKCSFSTNSKTEHWDHNRTHNKPEKLFTCPKCPFNTIYKHHLDYHINKHTGNKPFRCPSCPYRCVNKSMLSSHLKSHTTMRKYHCGDCQYSSKYCHTFKVHLRKYYHKPGRILNDDGSVSDTVFDVYGKKRGPKKPHIQPKSLFVDPCMNPWGKIGSENGRLSTSNSSFRQFSFENSKCDLTLQFPLERRNIGTPPMQEDLLKRMFLNCIINSNKNGTDKYIQDNKDNLRNFQFEILKNNKRNSNLKKYSAEMFTSITNEESGNALGDNFPFSSTRGISELRTSKLQEEEMRSTLPMAHNGLFKQEMTGYSALINQAELNNNRSVKKSSQTLLPSSYSHSSVQIEPLDLTVNTYSKL